MVYFFFNEKSVKKCKKNLFTNCARKCAALGLVGVTPIIPGLHNWLGKRTLLLFPSQQLVAPSIALEGARGRRLKRRYFNFWYRCTWAFLYFENQLRSFAGTPAQVGWPGVGRPTDLRSKSFRLQVRSKRVFPKVLTQKGKAIADYMLTLGHCQDTGENLEILEGGRKTSLQQAQPTT